MAKAPVEVQWDYVVGTDGDDVLWQPDSWAVTMEGMSGDDLFMARTTWNGAVANTAFYGGSGTDTVSYINSTTRVDIDLAAGVGYQQWPNGGNWETQSFDSIENLRGTLLPDELLGNAAENELRGEGGNDTLGGREGDDTLDGGSGHDSLKGGDDEDLLRGGSGNDTLKGEDGGDVLDGGTGNDILDGGGGADTARFDTSGSVVVNLGINLAVSALGNDTLSSIEYVVTGSGGDVVYGNGSANLLDLGGGNDYADGGSGNDSLIGGSGNDTLLGGSGNDVLSSGSGSNQLRGGAGADIVSADGGTDTLRWGAGDIGTDEILGFSVAGDKLAFDDALFGANIGPGEDIRDVRMVFNAPGVGALLMAQTASDGWSAIGRFHGVSAAALEGAIENGTIFAVGTPLGGGAPGDVLFG